MMKKFARVLALLMLVSIMVGVFAGCVVEPEDDQYTTKPSQAAVIDKPVIDEAVTITVLTTRHSGYTTEADDLWFFKYMEYWFAQQGYDVTFEVTQTMDSTTQVNLLLNTNSLPDLVFGPKLSNANVIKHALDDTLVLDWTPYINDKLMPNLTARFEAEPYIKTDSTAPDGGIYGLPYLKPGMLMSGCYGISDRFFIRESWLQAVGKEKPTTEAELIDVLKAFKTVNNGTGKASIPVVSSSAFLEKYLWTCLGFYGTEPAKYGTNLMIKDEKLVMPAYTPAYRDFIELMHTFYSEGIIAEDYFSYNDASAKALVAEGVAGAYCWWTLEAITEGFKDYVSLAPIPMGDVDSLDDIHVSRLSTYEINNVWASSATKYPELLAMMMDFMYSDDGAFLYRYGPKKGEDPLNLVTGHYYNDKGVLMFDEVKASGNPNASYQSVEAYGRDWLFPYDNVGMRPAVVSNGTGKDIEFTDSVTGEKYTVLDTAIMDPETNDGHYRLTTIDTWSKYATSVRLPYGIYLAPSDSDLCADLLNSIQGHIIAESAKFITGKRPLSEIDAFWKELEDLGIKTYLEKQTAARESWFAETYGK